MMLDRWACWVVGERISFSKCVVGFLSRNPPPICRGPRPPAIPYYLTVKEPPAHPILISRHQAANQGVSREGLSRKSYPKPSLGCEEWEHISWATHHSPHPTCVVQSLLTLCVYLRWDHRTRMEPRRKCRLDKCNSHPWSPTWKPFIEEEMHGMTECHAWFTTATVCEACLWMKARVFCKV